MLERHPDQRQQSKPYAPRRKRPDLFDEPPRSSGAGIRWLAGIIVVLVLAIALSRLTGGPEPEPVVSDTPPPPPPPPVRTAPPAVSLPPPQPAGAGATPTVDLMVRLEAHRQLVRAGNAVYLDSLLAESDSILRRWPARPREPVLVAVIRDSLADRAGTQGDAALRDAFNQWSQLRLGGLQFSFIQDTAQAQVVVEWIDQFDPEDKQTGQTDLTLASDGSIQYARMRLALRDPAGRRLDRPAMLTVALHEVGHVLGLGHSALRSDIMFPTPRTPSLSERDRRTVELVYGLPAGSVKGGNE